MRNPNTKCHQCGKPCYVRPGQMERQQVWFCGRECNDAWRQRKVKSQCEQCGEIYVKTNSNQKFCSRACSNKGRKGIKYGVGRPGCRMERIQYQRLALQKRDGVDCLECGQAPEWNGKHLVLQIDHIDGDRSNNDLSNLRLLCPNCYTQTETWGKRK